MTHLMRIAFVSVTFLSACSSVQKKPVSAPAPVAMASTTAVAKPVVPVQATKPAQLIQELSCEQGADKRTIKVEPKETGCEVHYSKFGNSEMVANAIHTPKFCDEVKDKIRAHLEAGQFTCK